MRKSLLEVYSDEFRLADDDGCSVREVPDELVARYEAAVEEWESIQDALCQLSWWGDTL